MDALVLNSSPRGKRSVTKRLLDALTAGLAEGGATVEEFDINQLNISPCTACLSCMHKKAGECSLRDDMDMLYGKLKNSDLLVLGAPVYLDNMPGTLKMIIDRCMCCMEPFLAKDSARRVRHTYAWRMPARFVLVSTSGFPEMETFAPLIATFRAEAENFASRAVAEICVPGSIALQVDPSKLKGHLAMLTEAGRSLSTTGEVSRELIERLNKPPLTVDEYLQLSGKYEAWARGQLGR